MQVRNKLTGFPFCQSERGSADVQVQGYYPELRSRDLYLTYLFRTCLTAHLTMRNTGKMKSVCYSLAGLFALLRLASSTPQTASNVKRQPSELLESYSFIIAGGGTSGLTIADRLTEAFPDGVSSFTFDPLL